MNVKIMSFEMVSAVGMGQRSKNVVMRDAPTMPRREEFVVGMGQSKLESAKNAAMKDLTTSP